MLTQELKTQLQAYMQRITLPIEIEASLDDSQAAGELRALLETIAGMSEKVQLSVEGADSRRPSFRIRRSGSAMDLRFAAVPLGHEFSSLVLALLWAGGHPPKVEASVLENIRGLSGPMDFEVFMSLSCHNCPEVVQALSLMAITNSAISVTVVDGALFQD